MRADVIHGDCLDVLSTLPAESVNCCVTSPPYWGLRDYGHEGQIGLEQTPEAYVKKLVAVFREVRRVLLADGTLWLNLGDSYASNPATGKKIGGESYRGSDTPSLNTENQCRVAYRGSGIKGKDLVGIPWRVAFALQADGWYLRSDIIWAKPNPMPESVTDRPTKAHEYVFLLTKSARYWYDAGAISEAASGDPGTVRSDQEREFRTPILQSNRGGRSQEPVKVGAMGTPANGQRNARSVWTIATQPFSGAHFATMPPKLAERCILAGCPEGGTVLDPFGGAGTTGLVADRLGRNSILIELNPAYAGMAERRIVDDAPLFAGG